MSEPSEVCARCGHGPAYHPNQTVMSMVSVGGKYLHTRSRRNNVYCPAFIPKEAPRQ